MKRIYQKTIIITLVAAIVLIAATTIVASILMNYAEAQWVEGLYFRNHQEYICDYGQVTFTFVGYNVGKKVETLPSEENSKCYIAGVQADNFKFSNISEALHVDEVQLKVYLTPTENFTATEIVFECGGEIKTYPVGKVGFKYMERDGYSENLMGATITMSAAGYDMSNLYSIVLRNESEQYVTLERIDLSFPDFENFIYTSEQRKLTFPLTIAPGSAVSVEITYTGGKQQSVIVLQPAIKYESEGKQYTRRTRAQIYYMPWNYSDVLELIAFTNQVE